MIRFAALTEWLRSRRQSIATALSLQGCSRQQLVCNEDFYTDKMNEPGRLELHGELTTAAVPEARANSSAVNAAATAALAAAVTLASILLIISS
jgi:hypothetical protein